jgi:transposase
MAMGRRIDQQSEMWVATERIAQSPGHPFYDVLAKLLSKHDFDRFCEARCKKFYAAVMGRPSLAPGVYFRMLMIGYFEGLDSERGIDWRCSDSLSLKQFLGYLPTENTPDHSTISRTRRLIDLDTHREIFNWVLKVVAEQGLLKGNQVGVDASTMEANAALRSIIRKDTGETYQEFLTKLAQASGIETPTKEQLIALDRKRKDKKLSNAEWVNPHDTDAKVAKMKDGRTHFAYKNEHAVDLQTGAILAAEIHSADQGDTTTGSETLSQACGSLSKLTKDKDVGHKVMTAAAMEVPADKGYHCTETIVALEKLGVRPYIAEPDRGRRNWRNATMPEGVSAAEARAAVYRNRRRMRGEHGKALHRKRGEFVERSFAHVLDTGGMRRAHLRGRENLHKRYLIHVCGFNLSLVMRKKTGSGTPRELADRNADGRRGRLRLRPTAISGGWASCTTPWSPQRPGAYTRAA